MSTSKAALKAGALNLLQHAAELREGQRVLLVCEDAKHGWYDELVPKVLFEEATNLGAQVTLCRVGSPSEPLPQNFGALIADHEIIVYLSRMGDQDRFGSGLAGKKVVMCYARNAESLASPYGRSDHRAFQALKTALNKTLKSAATIEITCPRGTHLAAKRQERPLWDLEDVVVERFPLGVPQPLSASEFSGTIALDHFLTPTGSKSYDPAWVKIPATVLAKVKKGYWLDLEGPSAVTALVRAHHDFVAELFGLEARQIHSWHAGIHPASAFPCKAETNPDLWSNSVFTNPRFLHFHCCGDKNFAEICWMVLDPTIKVDGEALWEAGRLNPHLTDETALCLEQWPFLKALFENPKQEIGL